MKNNYNISLTKKAEKFIKIMGKSIRLEHESMKRWADSQRYRKFDIDFVNRRLKHIDWE